MAEQESRRQQEIREEQESRKEKQLARRERRERLSEPTWTSHTGSGAPLTELLASRAGGLSPFGENHGFPLPPEQLLYAHPTDKPNRAGLMAGEDPKRKRRSGGR